MEIPALRVYEAIYSTGCFLPAMTDCNEKPARFFSGNAQNIIRIGIAFIYGIQSYKSTNTKYCSLKISNENAMQLNE